MAKISLPPGFRFHPTDVELVKYYLKRKVLGKNFRFDAIADVDIYKYAPWDLPDKSCLRSRDLKWYFFCERGKKYSTGVRMNRATDFGYWKATGKDRNVDYNNEHVGMIKTLVFHKGKAPKGDRTDWVMHEYRLEDKGLADKGVVQEAYVLCVIFRKDGPGPRNGAQYGAPFREEDWSDDEEVDCGEATPSAGPSGLGFMLPNTQISSVATTTNLPEGICIGTTSESCLSNTLPSSYNVLPPVSDVPMDAPQVQNDDVVLMLDCFKAVPLVSNENNSNERLDNFIQDGNVEVGSDGNDFFKDLEDLGTFGELSEGVYNFSCPDHTSYLELHDLDKPSPVVEHMQTDGPNVDYNCYNNSQQLSYPVNPCGATQHVFGLNHFSPMPPRGPHWFEDDVNVFHKGDVTNESASQRMFELNQFPPMLPGGPHRFDGHVDVFHKGGGADGSASQHVFGFNQSPPMLLGVPHGFEDHVDVFHEEYDADGSASQHVLGLNQSPPMLLGGPHGFEDHVDLFHMGDGADGSASQHVFRLNQSPPMLPGGPHGFEDHVDVFQMENGANGGVSQHVFGLNQSPPMLPGGPHGFEGHADVFHMGSGANGSVSQGYGNYEAALCNWDDTPFEQSVLGSSHASQDLGRGGFV